MLHCPTASTTVGHHAVQLAALSGLASLFTEKPFMTSIWWPMELGDASFYLSTPLVFDIGGG